VRFFFAIEEYRPAVSRQFQINCIAIHSQASSAYSDVSRQLVADSSRRKAFGPVDFVQHSHSAEGFNEPKSKSKKKPPPGIQTRIQLDAAVSTLELLRPTAFCRASRAQGIMPRKRSAHKRTGSNAALRAGLHGN
jgi:hypothetical protein